VQVLDHGEHASCEAIHLLVFLLLLLSKLQSEVGISGGLLFLLSLLLFALFLPQLLLLSYLHHISTINRYRYKR